MSSIPDWAQDEEVSILSEPDDSTPDWAQDDTAELVEPVEQVAEPIVTAEEEDKSTPWGLVKKGFYQSQAGGEIQDAARVAEEVDVIGQQGAPIKPVQLKPFEQSETQKKIDELKSGDLLTKIKKPAGNLIEHTIKKYGDTLTGPGMTAGMISNIALKDKDVALDVADSILNKHADEAIDNLKKASEIPDSKAMEKVMRAGDLGEAFSAFLDNPIDVSVDAMSSSAYPMAEVIVTGAVGAPFGPTGFVAGTFKGSFDTNYKSKFMEVLTGEGADLSTREGIKKALADKGLIRKANKDAFNYSLPIAVFDAASGGLASKTMASTPLRSTLAQTATQTGLGGGGEALGQISETGEISSPGEVLIEGLMEAPGGIIEPAIIGKKKLFGKKEVSPDTPDQGGSPPELFTPTHKAGGGQDVQVVTKEGQIVPDTYINAEGQVFRDSNAVPNSPDSNDVSMDVNATVGAIKAEIEAKRGGIIGGEMEPAQPDIATAIPVPEAAQDVISGLEAELEQPIQEAAEAPVIAPAEEVAAAQQVPEEITVPAEPKKLKPMAERKAETEAIKAEVMGEQVEEAVPAPDITPVEEAVIIEPVKKLEPVTAVEQTGEEVTVAANEAATSPENDSAQPTEAQKESGNYKKGHVRVQGLDIAIENPAGSKRRPEWPTLKQHYGYIKGTVGADSEKGAAAHEVEQIDVFVNPDKDISQEAPVFIIDQSTEDGVTFDEHKVMLGFDSEQEAREAYLANYTKDWKGLKQITQATQEEFKTWLDKGDTNAPYLPDKFPKQTALKAKLKAEIVDVPRETKVKLTGKKTKVTPSKDIDIKTKVTEKKPKETEVTEISAAEYDAEKDKKPPSEKVLPAPDVAARAEPKINQKVEDLSASLEKKYPLKTLLMSADNKGNLKLTTIIVEKGERKAGVGTKVMEDITEFADVNNLRMVLTPAVKDDFQGTTSRTRLVKFYKKFGFKENKGQNKDYTVSEGMIRDPQIKLPKPELAAKKEPDLYRATIAEEVNALKDKQKGWGIKDHYELAHTNQVQLNELGKLISEKSTAEYKHASGKHSDSSAGEKSKESAKRKVETKYSGDASNLTDIVRGTFIVRNPSEVTDILKGLSDKLIAVDEGWAITPSGYFDRKVLIQFDNGQIGELQIVTPNMLYAKEVLGMHDIYDDWRKTLEADPETGKLKSKAGLGFLVDVQTNTMAKTYAEAVRDETNQEWREVFKGVAQESLDTQASSSLIDIASAPSTTKSRFSSVQAPSRKTAAAPRPFESTKSTAGAYSYESEDFTVPNGKSIVSSYVASLAQTAIRGTGKLNLRSSEDQLQTGDFTQYDKPAKKQPKAGLEPGNLNRLVKNLQRDFHGLREITFHVRSTQAEAFGPDSVKKHGILKGGFYSGTNEIVLIAENIKDINDAVKVIRHEAVGHFGLRKLLNNEGEYDTLLDRVYESRTDELKDLYDWVAKTYPELINKNDVRSIADEMLARAAETKTKSNLLTEIYDAIIRLLNKFGIVLDTINHSEVNALIRLSEANLKKHIINTSYNNLVWSGKADGFVRSKVELAQIGTPAFKKWFGDSKVVDESGEPLTVYHGTNEEFNEFSVGGRYFGYFSDNKKVARDYGGNVGSFYIKIDDLEEIDMHGGWWKDDYGNVERMNGRLENGLIDGFVIRNTKDPKVFNPNNEFPISDIYVLKDPTQIKSATDNRGTFDAGDPRIRFSRAADDTNDAPTDGNLGMPDETFKEFMVRLMADSFNRVLKLQETIIERGGKVITDSDVYRAEERSSSKISYRLRKLGKQSMDPMLKLMKEKNISVDTLDLFLVAKHAQERNEYIASINDDMPDGGSGLTNQEARDILDELSESREALEEIAELVYTVNNDALDNMVEGGHIKQETTDEWRSRWNYYVPLKGKEGEEVRGTGTGTGFAISGAGIKTAMGRGAGNMAESPTAHSFAQAESIIVRTEKTKVGQALIELVRANPDPGFWTISKRTFKQFEDLYGEPFEGYDEAPDGLIENLDYHRVSAISQEERALAKKEGRKPVPKVVFRLDQNYKRRDDVFTVMVGGEELLINIKDKVLMEQLKKMNVTQLNAVVAGFSTLNRYLAMINTALNPEFVITNFERDFQTAMINLGGEHSVTIAKKVMKAIPGAMRGIWQSTFDTKGRSEWRELYDEMQESGGAIGFFGLEDIDAKVKNIQRKLTEDQGVLGKTKKGVLAVRDLVLDANLSVENASRLAAYKVIKEESIGNGMSEKDARAKAASVAKNLTVNFNRKGELAPVFNSAYLFYNASIQGSMRILTALKSKRVRKIVTGVAAMAYLQAMYNQQAGGDDDDGIPHWDKISDYTKQTSIIFMHPDGSGNYSKVRLPYGYNVFHYAGTSMYDLAYGKDSSLAKTTMNMLSATLNAFNPIQGADLLDTLTPTFLKPYEQDARNINFMGAKLKPEYPFDTYDRPESQKHFKSTNPELVAMMKAINEATGGDETHSGLIDVSPEIVSHYISWATGGAGMFASRTIGTAANLVSGEDIEMKTVPFLRTLGGKPGAHYDTDRYYKAIKEVAAVEAQIKLYKGTDKWSDYKQEKAEIHKLAFHVRRYKNKIKKLREQRDKAYIDDDRELAKEKTEDIRQKMMTFSMLYDEAIEYQND